MAKVSGILDASATWFRTARPELGDRTGRWDPLLHHPDVNAPNRNHDPKAWLCALYDLVVIADGKALVDLLDADIDDPRLGRVLAGFGLPEDVAGLAQLIEQVQDPADESGEGGGVATVRAPACSARLTFFRGADPPWYLAEVVFGAPQADRPACTDLPLGLRFGDSRASTNSWFGEPTIRAVFGADRWERPDLIVSVDYDSADSVRRMHFALSVQALNRRVAAAG